MSWLQRAATSLALPLSSIAISFALGAVVIAVTGGDPLLAYTKLLCGGLGLGCGDDATPALQISNTIFAATPLIFAALSVAIAFRGGLFNIGAEGQLIMGAIASVVVGIRFASWPAWALLPAILLAGILAGALMGGIVGVLKATTGANEVVTTLMLNYVALLLSQYLVLNGPLQSPHTSSISLPIGAGGRLPAIVPANVMFFDQPGAAYLANSGIFIALAAAIVFWVILRRTTFGYELRAVGQSQRAARYAGINIGWITIRTMLLAGAFAGLAGAVQIAGGTEHYLGGTTYISDTTGFDAIGVALLGQTGALGVVLAALLFGALQSGGQFIQSHAHISAELGAILQALILFCVAANFLRTFRPQAFRLPWWRQDRPPDEGAEEIAEAEMATPGTSVTEDTA